MNATQRPTRKRKSRKSRIIWIVVTAAVLALAIWLANGPFKMPDAPDARELMPGKPYLVVELRDAAESIEPVQQAAEAARSLWQPFINRYIAQEAQKEISAKDIAALLGEDAALALYRGENGETRWLLVAKTSLLARAQIGWNFMTPWWRSEHGAKKEKIGSINAMRIDKLVLPLIAAFDGRLGFAASDAELLKDAYEQRLEDAFFARADTPEESGLTERIRQKSPDRAASIYWAFGEEAYVLGETGMDGGSWKGRVWRSSPGGQTGLTESDTSDFRRRANRLMNESAALAAWHTGVYDRDAMEAARGAGLTWEGGPDALIQRPIGLYIPKAAGGGILPSLAFFVYVENAEEALEQFEDANFAFNGSRLRLRKGDPFHQIQVPLNALFAVSLECAVEGDALIVGTNRAAAAAARQAFQSTEGGEDLTADLFRIHGHPTEIAASLGAASSMLKALPMLAGDSIGKTVDTAQSVMKEIESVQIDGVSTPDGFSAEFQMKWSDAE